MFNTSTLISLGLTALLCGIIMFYCKRKFAEYEQKLDVMSDLISNIITQLNQIPSAVYDNSSFAPPGFNDEQFPGNIAMNIMPQVEEQEDDSDNDDEDNQNTENFVIENIDEDNRIIVNLGNNSETETNMISLNKAPVEEDSWDSEESDDEDDNNKISIQEHNLNVVVESEKLDSVENEVIAQEVAQKMVNKIIEDTSTISDEVKVIDTNAPVKVDYSKMQVSLLKKMVAERQLAQGVSKMKKQDLIDVLMTKSQQ